MLLLSCRNSFRNYSVLILLLLGFNYSSAQVSEGFLKGRIMDQSTGIALFGAAVSRQNSTSKITYSSVDGIYVIQLLTGKVNIIYKLPGYKEKHITGIEIKKGQYTYLDILLTPMVDSTNEGSITDSVSSLHFKDSLQVAGRGASKNSFLNEQFSHQYNFHRDGKLFPGDKISYDNISPGIDKNALFTLRRLNGVIIEDNPSSPQVHSFLISGMGERYNQLMLNGAIVNFFDPLSRSYPLQLIPSEAVEEVTVQKTGNASMPSDYAGGTVSLKTKDYTDRNFFYIQAGAGFSEGTLGENFYGDKRNKIEFLGLSGSQRALPSAFPTTRSEFALNSRNIQEQVFLSKQLNNNLAAKNYGSSKPDYKILIGFGKRYKLKKGAVVSVVGYINQSKNEQFSVSKVQVAPNVSENPYPFTAPGKSVVFSQSTDSNYNYSSQLSGILNASIVYGRNKISFRNFLGGQFSNNYRNRTAVYKPGEDTLAHSGIGYLATQRIFINSQVAGEHILSANNKFRMDWQASYTYLEQQNPDERNFLLRADSGKTGSFELSTPFETGSFTNSGRLWRNSIENNFTGSLNLSFPFKLFHQVQVLRGGIYIQQNYRVFTSDLLFTQGTGYVPTEELIAPERYYPGGVSVTNFYLDVKDFITNGGTTISPREVKPYSRSSYSANANLGASYLQWDARLTNQVSLHLGGRMESVSQLASNDFYQYAEGFKYPLKISLDENTRISSYSFLPSINLIYTPVKRLNIQAAYFKTVNRPQLQELVQYVYYDASSFMAKRGNPLLATASIDNYNAGFNFLANAFSTFGISAFYKNIDQPIEYIVTDYNKGNMIATPHNTPPAVVMGIDASFRINLNFLQIPWISGVTVFGNGNFTQSKVDAGPIRSNSLGPIPEHDLSGTPDYSINGGITVQHENLPTLTVLYNRTSDYISALGSGKMNTLANGNSIVAIPDYRVKGRDQLDIQVSQKFFRSKIQLIAGINNLLDDPYIQYQDLNGNDKFDAPLQLNNNAGNGGGYYSGGTDNTIISIPRQRVYYLTLSYLFK